MPEATKVWADQVAIVTGGLGSIGSAIAERFESLGARVAISDLNAAPAVGERRRVDELDVTDSAAVDAWIASVAQAWGPPTIGIICAGISKAGRLVDLADADWRDVLAVNLDGAYFTARAVIRQMLAGKVSGRLVFVGSWAAQAPHPHIGAYSTSKAGLRALCRTFALDHAEDDIFVNEVAPGVVDAGLSRELFRTNLELAQRIMAAIPSGRLSQPEDVARDVTFLASPENWHTTGTCLVSDGGVGLASLMNTGHTRE